VSGMAVQLPGKLMPDKHEKIIPILILKIKGYSFVESHFTLYSEIIH